jgi:uncharacterized protein
MFQRFFIATVSLVFLSGCGGTESSAPVESPAQRPTVEASATSETAPADEQASADGTANAPEESVNTAAYNGNVEALKQHVAAGSNLNEPDPTSGSTALITAATFDKREAVKVLIEGGADLNLQNREGSTPLHTASFLCRTEIVEMLLKAGANKEAMNKVGSTALNGVEGPFEQMKPIYDLLGVVLGPLGLKLDYERITATRPKIAEMLR